jgi:D-beta-D-heptose 7-phosphate kinase/D-beta-D-heptose 1-phosphate adenosyltransferase
MRHGLFDRLPAKPILVIGDVIVDHYIIGAASRLSPEAPVPVLRHQSEYLVPGGAANVALNAAALGANVTLVGLVGADALAERLRTELISSPNVDTAGLVTDSARPTTVKTRIVAERQQLVRIDNEVTVEPGIAPIEKLVANATAAMPGAGMVVLSDYAKGTLTPTVISAVIAAAKTHGVPVLVDPKHQDFARYRGANLIKPNAAELERSTGLSCASDVETAEAAIRAGEQFGGDVLVTRGEKGMLLRRCDGSVTHFPTEPIQVSDVSGAGDTSLAALAVWLSSGYAVDDAIRVANKAAGLAVTRFGTSVVDRETLKAAIEASQPFAQNFAQPMTLEEAVRIAARWRQDKHRIALTNGCFDLLHPGHIQLLDYAASQGSRLIVALNADTSVRRLKGRTRPVQDELARARVLGSLRMVDLVVLFDEDTPLGVIEALRPDILVKGADYTRETVVGADFVESYGGKVALAPLVANRSTTLIIKQAVGQ